VLIYTFAFLHFFTELGCFCKDFLNNKQYCNFFFQTTLKRSVLCILHTNFLVVPYNTSRSKDCCSTGFNQEHHLQVYGLLPGRNKTNLQHAQGKGYKLE